MEKHLLITISDDVSCHYGIRFVRSFFQRRSGVRITLFYVSPIIDPAVERSRDRGGLDRKMAESYRRRGQQALDAGKQLLTGGGFSSELIDCKFMHKQFGTVMDIIKEGKAGLYDAVVMGRRGYMLLEPLLANSVSKEIIAREVDFPIWICRRPEEQRRNVLLCVDGSEPSLRMADHVGFMLKDEPDHSIKVLHIDTGHGKHVDSIVEGARAELLQNGIEESRITTSVVRSSRVVKSILDEVEKNSFGVVAVGRVGAHKGSVKEWLVGSKSTKLVEELEKAVLWVSK